MSYLQGWESVTERLDAKCGRGWQPGPGGKCKRATKEDRPGEFRPGELEELFGKGTTEEELDKAASEFGNKVALGGGILAGGLLAAGAASSIGQNMKEKRQREEILKAIKERKAKEAEARQRRSSPRAKSQ